MSKIDITAHAEVILGVVLDCEHSGLLAAYVNDDSHRQAILAAVTAVFDAGALAMREAAASTIDCAHGFPTHDYEPGFNDVKRVRNIDPASLREVRHD